LCGRATSRDSPAPTRSLTPTNSFTAALLEWRAIDSAVGARAQPGASRLTRGRPPSAASLSLKRKEPRMSALDTALDTIDAVAGEGDLAASRAAVDRLELESTGKPTVLPDGRRISPPRLAGQPIDELACALLNMNDPRAVDVVRDHGDGFARAQDANAA
jgi:hypothetical protein